MATAISVRSRSTKLTPPALAHSLEAARPPEAGKKESAVVIEKTEDKGLPWFCRRAAPSIWLLSEALHGRYLWTSGGSDARLGGRATGEGIDAPSSDGRGLVREKDSVRVLATSFPAFEPMVPL